VRIEGTDRPGLERLLWYCACPAFALEGLREIDAEHVVHERIKPGPGGGVSLMLTPIQLIGCLAALIPPPNASLRGRSLRPSACQTVRRRQPRPLRQAGAS
jgi:hypothetical protein